MPALYDGQRRVGSVEPRAGAFAALDADGRLLGTFESERAASRSISARLRLETILADLAERGITPTPLNIVGAATDRGIGEVMVAAIAAEFERGAR